MFQTIIIAGNLGRDPEMRYTADGKAVTNFSVAVSRGEKTGANGQKVKTTAWFRVSVWDKMAEVCNQYLKKGSKVLVEGYLNVDPNTGGPRVYTRQDGSVGCSFEIQANVVRFLSSKAESEALGQGQSEEEDDEMPF